MVFDVIKKYGYGYRKYSVYAVERRYSNSTVEIRNDTLFLIYNEEEGEWEWKPASEFKPV